MNLEALKEFAISQPTVDGEVIYIVPVAYRRSANGDFVAVHDNDENVRRAAKAAQIYRSQCGDNARAIFHANLDLKGSTCPTCDRWGERYEHSINGKTAAALVVFYAMALGDLGKYIHMEELVKNPKTPLNGRADFAKLRFWGLIERKTTDDRVVEGKVKNTGCYRITQRGVDFVLGNVKIEETVLLYNDTFYGFKGGEVSIHDCWDKQFNYAETMRFDMVPVA